MAYLSIENLTVSYGEKVILKELNLQIPEIFPEIDQSFADQTV